MNNPPTYGAAERYPRHSIIESISDYYSVSLDQIKRFTFICLMCCIVESRNSSDIIYEIFESLFIDKGMVSTVNYIIFGIAGFTSFLVNIREEKIKEIIYARPAHYNDNNNNQHLAEKNLEPRIFYGTILRPISSCLPRFHCLDLNRPDTHEAPRNAAY